MIQEFSYMSSEEGGVYDDAPEKTETVMDQSISLLEADFLKILTTNTIPLNATMLHKIASSTLTGLNSEVQEDVRGESCTLPSVLNLGSDEELTLDLVHPAAIYELKKIADRFIRSGYEKECCLLYSSVRSNVLDGCLKTLGIEKEVQKMEKWIPALKILVKLILIEEKYLCEQVFASSELMSEVCFVESARGCVVKMLNFGKEVAVSEMSSKNLSEIFEAAEVCKSSSEKLFRTLDTYDALSEVMPDLEELFNGDSGAGEMVCIEAKDVLEGLCEAATATFVEFEKAVREEASTSTKLENGDVHPVTQHVMNCVKMIVDYSEILNGVFEKTDYDEIDEVENEERMPCITRRLWSLIRSLESNLQEKARMYDDIGLQSVFLMNNVLHIVSEVKDSEVRNMLGYHCISKWRGQIRQYAGSYLRCSWTKALDCLRVEGFRRTSGLRRDLISRVRYFNDYFEDTCRTQTTWKVSNPQLRQDLCILVSQHIDPMYRRFLVVYDHIEREGKYIKYTPDDLSKSLLDLFEGVPYTPESRKCSLCS